MTRSSHTLPRDMGTAIALHARSAGARPTETGGFILAHPGQAPHVLAVAGERGVERQRDLFCVSTSAITELFEWAGDENLTVVSQWHTHRMHAFLSDTDLRFAYNVEGLRNMIVPDYARASPDPAAWGWWVYSDGAWVPEVPPQVGNHHFTTIAFDEDGIHGS
ncbi:MAG: hypothetical protein JWL76_1448 [Thermoleophilia bacterium]|nr:hypothetical protein [Thermoleophilia bacterium]